MIVFILIFFMSAFADTVRMTTIGLYKFSLSGHTIEINGDNNTLAEQSLNHYEITSSNSERVRFDFIDETKVVILFQDGHQVEYKINLLYQDENFKCYDIVRKNKAQVCFDYNSEMIKWYQNPVHYNNIITWNNLYYFCNIHFKDGEKTW